MPANQILVWRFDRHCCTCCCRRQHVDYFITHGHHLLITTAPALFLFCVLAVAAGPISLASGAAVAITVKYYRLFVVVMLVGAAQDDTSFMIIRVGKEEWVRHR